MDRKYTFEVGGKDKTFRQLAGLENAYIAADDIEYGMDRKIPLWLFGFLY
ncbi:MAG: AAA family ATPase [Prolixibacteraceae bacterium]